MLFPAIQLSRSLACVGLLGVATPVRASRGLGRAAVGKARFPAFSHKTGVSSPWRSNAELGPYLGEIGVFSWDRRIRDFHPPTQLREHMAHKRENAHKGRVWSGKEAVEHCTR